MGNIFGNIESIKNYHTNQKRIYNLLNNVSDVKKIPKCTLYDSTNPNGPIIIYPKDGQRKLYNMVKYITKYRHKDALTPNYLTFLLYFLFSDIQYYYSNREYDVHGNTVYIRSRDEENILACRVTKNQIDIEDQNWHDRIPDRYVVLEF